MATSNKPTQIVKVNKSVLEYFEMIVGFDNESEDFRTVTREEFKQELTKALNNGVGNKEIVWID